MKRRQYIETKCTYVYVCVPSMFLKDKDPWYNEELNGKHCFYQSEGSIKNLGQSQTKEMSVAGTWIASTPIGLNKIHTVS